jgi:multidrug transporter EmrE-like cation transporter
MLDKALPWILLFAAILLEVAGSTLNEAEPRLLRAASLPRRSSVLRVLGPCRDPGAEAARAVHGLRHLVGRRHGTMAYFREPLTLFKMASLALVILGVVGLSVAARQTN